jgi:hypothetical protein
MKPIILAASPWVQNHPTSARRVVLRTWNDHTPYVVHTEYRDTQERRSVFEGGTYCHQYKNAWNSFMERATRQTDEPLLLLPV